MDLRTVLTTGVLSGVAGALAMSSARYLMQQAGILSEPLPHKIERRIAIKIGLGALTSARQESILAQALHLTVGAINGIVYPMLRQRMNLPPAVAGPLFGLVVYTVNVVGVGSIFHLVRSGWRRQPAVVGRRILIHLLYGLVVALVYQKTAVGR
jgi:Mg/Co/Ni transporter MgtE